MHHVAKIVTNCLLLGGMIGLTLGLTACVPAGKQAPAAPPVNTDFTIEVPRVMRYEQIGRFHADGVYLLPQLAITNQTPADRLMTLKEWQLQHRPPVMPQAGDTAPKGKPLPLTQRPVAYQQAPETNANVIVQAYLQSQRLASVVDGDESPKPQAFKQPDDAMHPQLPAHRLLVFQVPATADLSHYTLQWQPSVKPGLPVGGAVALNTQPIVVPLLTATTKVEEVLPSPSPLGTLKKRVGDALEQF